MKSRSPALALLLLLPIALLAGCNAALGPGYTVKKQQLDARWTGTLELEVRGTYRLQNTGKAPLGYIEVTLPAESRRSGLQVSLGGSPVATQPADELAPEGTVRIPISPALPQKKKRDLLIEYRLARSVGDVSAAPSFYLETRGWYPALREREGLFGSGGAPPEKWDLRITVPRDFLVHASGQPRGRKRRGDSVEHHFRQRTGQNFDPFALAGKFYESRTRIGSTEISLWSPRPVEPAAAPAILERLAETAQVFERAFGPRSEDSRFLLFVDGISSSVPHDLSAFDVQTFPDAVWRRTSSFHREPNKAELWFADWHLARVWFFHLARPESAAENLAEAFSQYAPALVPGNGYEALQSLPRDEQIANRLEDFDCMVTREALFSAQDREVGKALLFLLALEDRIGRDRLLASTKRMLQALQGRTWTTNDLRVAIHIETGEDPADFFRQWLNQPGIPEEFRKRYEKPREGNRE
jgi:hypothetical protein